MVEASHGAHHRRIRRKAIALHAGLAPLALIVPLAWIYLAVGSCQEAESPLAIRACGALGFSPLLPAALAVAVLAWIAWDLARLGAHMSGSAEPRWGHARHGYLGLDARHRSHVHWAALQTAAVSLALVAWLLWLGIRSTR